MFYFVYLKYNILNALFIILKKKKKVKLLNIWMVDIFIKILVELNI